jgi:DNA ligase-1
MSSSNSKRRKLNNGDKSSATTFRGLDHYFGKKKAEAPGPASPSKQSPRKESDTNLTDEQLARQLQAEWDKEDARLAGSPTKPEGSSSSSRQSSNQDKSGQEFQESQITPDSDIEKDIDDERGNKNDNGKSAEQPQAPKPAPKTTLSLQSGISTEDILSYSIPFDESPLTFDPEKYVPDLKKQWTEQGNSASYAILTQCFVLINSTSSRIKIVDTVTNLLRILIEGDPSSLISAVWLATNSISPPYISLELGLGGSAIGKALKQVCGLDAKGLKTLYDKYGDAGDVAFEAKKKQSLTLRKPKPLTINGVYDSLVKIAKCQGNKSNERKQGFVDKLLQDTRGAEESRYIVRTLSQHVSCLKPLVLLLRGKFILLTLHSYELEQSKLPC